MAKIRKKLPKKRKKESRALKTKLTKKQLINHLAMAVRGDDVVDPKIKQIVIATLDALADTMARSLMPGGIGIFMVPKLFKITLRTKKEIKKGTMVRSPASGEMVPSRGRPESQSVKIRPLVMLKKAALGDYK